MKEIKDLVIFDFCETLIKFQTADRFVDFCRQKNPLIRQIILNFFHKIFTKFKIYYIIKNVFCLNGLSKRFKLKQLEGLTESQINKWAKQYYEEVLKPNIIQDTIKELQNHVEKGNEVWIVSGGYDKYIRFFVEDYGLTGFIATKIAFNKKNLCFGKIEGLDCMGENKITLLNSKFNNKNRYRKSFSYSDSISDLPLLKWTDEGIVVSKKESNLWAKEHKLKELIWD